MKNIQILFAGLLCAGLSVATCSAQTERETSLPPAITPTEAPDIVYPNSITEDPDVPVVAPIPENEVQPIARPIDNNELPIRSTPAEAEFGAPTPDYRSTPMQPQTSPSIERLYQNRIEVDQYAPVNPQTPSLSPPPGNMQPETAPGRPGTIGGTSK